MPIVHTDTGSSAFAAAAFLFAMNASSLTATLPTPVPLNPMNADAAPLALGAKSSAFVVNAQNVPVDVLLWRFV